MGFMVSPGVSVTEVDLSTVIPAVSSTTGALAGHFKWGPVGVRTLVSSEDVLVANFNKPNANTAVDFFTASNFLSYSNALYVSRVVGTGALNANSNANTASIVIKNEEDYIHNHSAGITGMGNWVAKYPGDLGNSLKVSFCSSATAWESTLTGTVAVTYGSKTVTGTGTSFDAALVGEYLVVGANTVIAQVAAVANTTSLTLVDGFEGATRTGLTSKRRWAYYPYFDKAPSTSSYAANVGGSKDEIHVIVEDYKGAWTGQAGTILEKFPGLSLASDAKTDDGATKYYKEVINQTSRYIWHANHDGGNVGAGGPATATFTGQATAQYDILSKGKDGGTPADADYINGYDLFKSSEDVDVSIILGGGADTAVANYLIGSIAESRKDCVVCLSPPRAAVVNNALYAGSETASIITFRNTLPSSSYAILDGNWKYQYDRYNDLYRYVPLNGDVGGLMVRTDNTRDPWWSPAGFNRGNIKNVIRLAFNPRQADRDELYKLGINPVVSFPGQGTVLYGDKTLLANPSAFDRINVRRLFIVLEKAIATASKFMLFEFNDAFTRQQFRNMVEPFLRDVQGRRGIYDFKVVADDTNNTGEVIDRNEFVGDIYIKPAKSINYINLTFVATRTGVSFDEVSIRG